MPTDPTSQLYFESYGSEDSPAIVFLHGGGLGGWMWREQVKAFQSTYHVLVPDLPEQGKNPARTGPYTTETAADRIAGLIQAHARGGKAHVVGLSEGAQVVVALLSRHPEVLDHAVVSSAILRPMWANMFAGKSASWMYRWFMAPFKNNDAWIRANMKGQTGLSEDYFPAFKETFQATSESGLVNMMNSAMSFRLPAGLEQVQTRVLVICGKKEYKEMRQSALDLVHVLPNACGALVSLGKGSSLAKEHGWALTAPALFNAAVKAWVEDKTLPSELLPLE
jgi:pimeloyl-ACP methyl ester carboxylesterase